MGKTSHQNLNGLVKELSDHLQKLNDGKLKLDEIEGLVNSAKEIYERLIVVRHKAYENFGEPVKKAAVAAAVEKPVFDEPKIEAKIEAPVIQQNVEAELKPFDFTAFQDDSAKSVPEPKIIKQSSIAKDFDFSEDAFDESEIEEKSEPIISTPVKKSIDVVRAEIKSESSSFHQKFLKEEDQPLNQKLKQDEELPLRKKLIKPATDFRKEIGIGKKFEYINFLFGGDAKAYEEGIDALNACPDKATCKQILADFGIKYNWDLNEKTILKFIELVERKFL